MSDNKGGHLGSDILTVAFLDFTILLLYYTLGGCGYLLFIIYYWNILDTYTDLYMEVFLIFYTFYTNFYMLMLMFY